MKVKISPSKVSGEIKIPASKSMAHRAIICASLSKGTSIVSNCTNSKDIEATISCMSQFGATIEQIDDTTYKVTGTDLFQQTQDITCNANESGSTLRFLIPLAACTKSHVTFVGQGRLLQRPMDIYKNEFESQNIQFEQDETKIRIYGNLNAKDYILQGNISSQFITGLMFVLPLLDQTSTLTITEPYESKSYVNLTIQMLKQFGIQIIETSHNTYEIPGQQTYQARDIVVEGDYSQVAFFAVLSTLNNNLTCTNMDPSSQQGDKAILDCIPRYTFQDNRIHFQQQEPKPQIIDLSNCPDLGPILCVLAAYTPGETKIIHAQRLRIKESDRILAMETELRKWGVDIQSTYDEITIHGKSEYKMNDIVEIFGHNDHRIVMAMTVFGLCAKSQSIIDDAQAISKSYPTFFEDIINIHGKVEEL